MIAIYLTHPQVEVLPDIPVPDWPLSARGRERTAAIAGRPWLRAVKRIVSSPERKARETAALLASSLSLPVELASGTGENDRSSTGFLPPGAFEAAADRFFGEPEVSWQGWERAVDASARIAAAVQGVLHGHSPDQSLLIVGHGAVGTLLKCRLSGRPISRKEDQPAGGGNIFAFRLADRRLIQDWTPMEDFHGCVS